MIDQYAQCPKANAFEKGQVYVGRNGKKAICLASFKEYGWLQFETGNTLPFTSKTNTLGKYWKPYKPYYIDGGSRQSEVPGKLNTILADIQDRLDRLEARE